jgi:HlyD family secretion protein
MKRDIDLEALARAPVVARPRRRWLPRLAPWLLLIAFLAVVASTLTDWGRGAVAVTLIRPQSAAGAGGGGGMAMGSELQRSGWIEPDPFPIHVNPLVAGIVRELLVLEGDRVEAGQVVARLDDSLAQAAAASSDAAVAVARAEAASATVERDAAQRAFDAALAVTEALALAEAEAKAKAAAAKVAEEELAVARMLAEHGGAGPREVELAAAKSELAQADLAKARATLERAVRERELRLDERARIDTTTARVAVAQAAVVAAEARAAEARLALERHAVVAPAAGVVLQRMAAPGMATGSPEHVALLSLYDPMHLRVRVDVEQSEVAKLAVGGAAAVRAPTRPGQDYHGTITRIVRQANVEKVTLQVHVRIDDPDEALRPEMVVETRFALAPAEGAAAASGGAPAAGGASDAFWIPARLLDARDGTSVVWVVNGSDGRAALRRVTVARRDGERALISAGLNASDKLLDGPRDRLREGAHLEIATEGR